MRFQLKAPGCEASLPERAHRACHLTGATRYPAARSTRWRFGGHPFDDGGLSYCYDSFFQRLRIETVFSGRSWWEVEEVEEGRSPCAEVEPSSRGFQRGPRPVVVWLSPRGSFFLVLLPRIAKRNGRGRAHAWQHFDSLSLS